MNRIGPRKSEKFYDRATHKLAWFLTAGHSLLAHDCDATTSLRLFSEVTNNEMSMSDREFLASWTDEAAHIRRRIRIENGALPDDTGKLIVKLGIPVKANSDSGGKANGIPE
jgi:hypothetical protein